VQPDDARARDHAPDAPNYFDLENPLHLRRLEVPMTALAPLEEIVVIDEIHRRPQLFPARRVLIGPGLAQHPRR